MSCFPKKCDSAITWPFVPASDWYGGRRMTTTSPLRFGCSESEPSTFQSAYLFSTCETGCWVELFSARNALRTAVRTCSYVGKVGLAVL